MNHNSSSIARHLGIGAAASVVAAAGTLIALAGGCQSLTRSVTEPLDGRPAVATPPPERPSDRPMVKVTAADLYSWGPGAAAQQLEFYDELERRDLVAHDDLLHATLLFAQGSSGATYHQRLELAKAQGWLDRGFSRPGREAVTVGEATQVMARMMGTPGADSPEAAVAAFRDLGLLPAVAEPAQGLTGPQMLALLTNSYDYLESGQTGRRALAQRPQDPPVAWVDTPSPTAAAPATAGAIEEESFEEFEEPAPSPAAPPVVAAAPADPGQTPRPMNEPLPEVPEAEAPKPAAPTPSPTPPPPPPAPATPEPDPDPEPAAVEPAKPKPTPRPWVGGKPLKKGGSSR